MAQPYVGEIRMFAGNFAPAGWAFCGGQLAAIDQNETLFQLIGTTYGGDGQSTFGLPDLRGRLPVHMGSGLVLGQAAGVETVTLSVPQMPAHSHPWVVSSSVASQTNPQNNMLAQSTQATLYRDTSPNTGMADQVVTVTGGSQPHDNIQPFVCISFIISLYGIFPSPT